MIGWSRSGAATALTRVRPASAGVTISPGRHGRQQPVAKENRV